LLLLIRTRCRRTSVGFCAEEASGKGNLSSLLVTALNPRLLGFEKGGAKHALLALPRFGVVVNGVAERFASGPDVENKGVAVSLCRCQDFAKAVDGIDQGFAMRRSNLARVFRRNTK
jgi:hypothetical protein